VVVRLVRVKEMEALPSDRVPVATEAKAGVMAEQLNMTALGNLVRANEVRLKRADDKRKIAVGRKDVATMLADVPEHWQTAKLVDLLLAMPRVGRVKAGKWCRLEKVALDTPLRDLSRARRLSLARHVEVERKRRDDVRRDLEGRIDHRIAS
jgi:hypothetical protein